MPDPAIAAHTPIVQSLQQALNSVLLGKPHAVRSALTCLLAGGHLLIEDLPGMGKTLLAHGLAKVLGLSCSRVQFTGDLLPADITGGAVFERDQSSFRFVPGPIFTEVLLADEINRAAPRTQSALLEAMAEGQVTVDGETHALPDPFFVIATQNPHTHAGTFPLPESQLDRFLMRIELGFPDPEAERQLLRQGDQRPAIRDVVPLLDASVLVSLQAAVRSVGVSDALLDYVQRLIQATRADDRYGTGLSPRGALGLLQAARAWAFTAGRMYVLPEDVQAVLPAVVTHRLRGAAVLQVAHRGASDLAGALIAAVSVIE
ncbi:MAG: AAA family ATPase [Gammaproteobacteria bacterium]